MSFGSLTLKENNNAVITTLVKTSVGGPQDVTGWSFQFLVQDKNGATIFNKDSSDVLQIAILDAVNGRVAIYVKPVDTNGKPGNYKYEFKGTDPSNNDYTLDGPSDISVTATLI